MVEKDGQLKTRQEEWEKEKKMSQEEWEKEKKMSQEEWEKEKKKGLEEWEKEKKGLDARVVELEHQLAEAGRAREEGVALVVAANDRLADAVAMKELGTTPPFTHSLTSPLIHPLIHHITPPLTLSPPP